MNKEIISKANEIVKLIEENKSAVSELEKYAESGKTLYIEARYNRPCSYDKQLKAIKFENWEIRLMIHNKKQRIAALEKQLERL